MGGSAAYGSRRHESIVRDAITVAPVAAVARNVAEPAVRAVITPSASIVAIDGVSAVHGGWTEVSSDAARQALLELGTTIDSASTQPVPLSRPTNGVRASAEFLATFFSGALAIGVTRPLDEARGWKFTWRIGQGF